MQDRSFAKSMVGYLAVKGSLYRSLIFRSPEAIL